MADRLHGLDCISDKLESGVSGSRQSGCSFTVKSDWNCILSDWSIDGAVLCLRDGDIDGVPDEVTVGAEVGTTALLGTNDGHVPQVALHAWKTPFLEHCFLLIFAQVFSLVPI